MYTNSFYSAHGFSHVTIIMVTFICFWFCRFWSVCEFVSFVLFHFYCLACVCVCVKLLILNIKYHYTGTETFAGTKSNCCFFALSLRSVKLNIHTIIYAILGIKSICLHSSLVFFCFHFTRVTQITQ